MALTDEELAEIEKRVKLTPGTWHPDSFGAPVVCLGYAEKLINMLPKTQLYLRAKRNEKFEDEMAKFVKLAEQLKPLFAPAYQAHCDVATLLGEVRALRERLAKADALLERHMKLHVPITGDPYSGNVTLVWRDGEQKLMFDIGAYLEAINEKTPPHP